MPKRKKSTHWLTFPKESDGLHRTLSPLEENFISASELGDGPTVKRILEEHTSLNVDFCDVLGRTPLHLAIANDHLEVVQLLMDRSSVAKIREALLLAISSDHEQIAGCILRHRRYGDTRKEDKRFGKTDYFFATATEDSAFSSDITPLILASERNQFEIVQLLLEQGETIAIPHRYYCTCRECSNRLAFDQLRQSKSRLNAYRGLASTTYISLSSTDPILTAFELARELLEVSREEKYFKSEYLSLADQLSDYVVKLLYSVRGHDELKVLIDKAGRDSEDETYENLARLKLAIHYNQKKFVVHPSCQQYLLRAWYGHLHKLEGSDWFYRTLVVLSVVILYPFMCVIYFFAPKAWVGHFLRVPSIKFIGHTMFYTCFLAIILASSILKAPSSNVNITEMKPLGNYYRNFSQNASQLRIKFPPDFKLRDDTIPPIDALLTLWILGMLWMELKQVFSDGIYYHFDRLFNYMDFAVLTLYITSFTLRFVSIIKVKQALHYFEEGSAWDLLRNDTEEAMEKFYWLIPDRLYWDQFDPENVGEGLFAIGNIMSFMRLTYLFAANDFLGPLKISLGRMIEDITKFILVFVVIIVAFMVGLHNLYWYYPIKERAPSAFSPHNVSTEAEEHFGIWINSFRTVFWSIFGRGEYTLLELRPFPNYFTEQIGQLIFGFYNIVTAVVLLNMLIAMMSRSFDKIQEDADTEWKFARTKLYLEYIKEGCTLPIPLNIIPTPKAIYKLLKSFFALFRKQDQGSDTPAYTDRNEVSSLQGWSTRKDKNIDNPNLKRQQDQEIGDIQQDIQSTTNDFNYRANDPSLPILTLTYRRVIKRIVKRYIFSLHSEADRNDDLDEIKQDLTSFRYEMLNLMAQGANNEEKKTTMQLTTVSRDRDVKVT